VEAFDETQEFANGSDQEGRCAAAGASVECSHCAVLAGHSWGDWEPNASPGPECKELLMDRMMSSGMMWGMGLGHILIAIVLILGAAALIKYLFFR